MMEQHLATPLTDTPFGSLPPAALPTATTPSAALAAGDLHSLFPVATQPFGDSDDDHDAAAASAAGGAGTTALSTYRFESRKRVSYLKAGRAVKVEYIVAHFLICCCKLSSSFC